MAQRQMVSTRRSWAGWLVLAGLLVAVCPVRPAPAADEGTPQAEPQSLKLAQGSWTLEIPGSWEVGKPRLAMVEHEIKVPRVDGDPADGRLTMMAAGGSVQANVDRWVGQFKGGKPPQVEKVKVGDVEVQIVDISGTFLERAGGPVAPAAERPNYRLLGAIVPLGGDGNYFLKLTGPEKTIAEQAPAFRKAVESLKQAR